MSFLLDTCVISELRKQNPDAGVSAWFETCDEDMLYLCTVTLGELRYGIDLLPDGKQKTALRTWYEKIRLSYAGHILEVTLPAFERWGSTRAARQRVGCPLSIADGLIAAAAAVNSMTLVTRNTSDFVNRGVDILNPWHVFGEQTPSIR